MNQTEQTESLVDRWNEIITPSDWRPIHPEWPVQMLRKGEPLLVGCFMLSAADENGKALYRFIYKGDRVERDGDVFHYRGVGAKNVLTWLALQIDLENEARTEAMHRARMELEDLCAEYRETMRTSYPQAASILREIITTIDREQYGCIVQFDEKTGEVQFLNTDKD